MNDRTSRDWVALSPGQARRHPRYGLNGILFAFYALILGGLLVRAATLSMAMGLSAFFPPADVQISGVLLAAGISLPVPFLVLSLIWRRAMPVASIACIWASVALDAGLVMLGLMAPVALAGMIGSTVAAPCLTYYVLLSKRVNVTYRHRVRWNDPVLATPEFAGPQPA